MFTAGHVDRAILLKSLCSTSSFFMIIFQAVIMESNMENFITEEVLFCLFFVVEIPEQIS